MLIVFSKSYTVNTTKCDICLSAVVNIPPVRMRRTVYFKKVFSPVGR